MTGPGDTTAVLWCPVGYRAAWGGEVACPLRDFFFPNSLCELLQLISVITAFVLFCSRSAPSKGEVFIPV